MHFDLFGHLEFSIRELGLSSLCILCVLLYYTSVVGLLKIYRAFIEYKSESVKTTLKCLNIARIANAVLETQLITILTIENLNS